MATTKKTTTRKAASKPAAKKTAKASSAKAGAKKTAAKKATPRANAAGDKKLSGIDAAAKLLGETKQPMNCRELVDAMAAKGYWKSPGGKTPHATLYSAILREINLKGKDARFKKTERGKFTIMG